MWLIWALLSALFAGLTAVFAKIGVVSINPNLATAIRTSIIVVITWGIALTTSRTTDLLRLPLRSWLFLSLSAIATGLSWLCYFRALQIGEVAKVAPIDKLSVVVAIVISVLFLGERLSVRESLGVCLIVCGALCLAEKYLKEFEELEECKNEELGARIEEPGGSLRFPSGVQPL